MLERMSYRSEAHAEALDEHWLKERQVIEGAHVKALELFAEGEEIDPRSFTDFDPAMVASDLAYVKSREKDFLAQETTTTRRARLYATAFEGVIHDQVEMSDWFGTDAMTRRASRYDDIANGVDSIVEFPNETDETGESVMALSLDVTFTRPEKKLERIMQEIQKGSLGRVKYFVSADGQTKKSLSFVPRVIIGADPRQIARVSDLWVNNKRKQLAEDPLQIQILQEILLQLKTFRAFAAKQNVSTRGEMVAAYDHAISLINEVYLDDHKQDLRHRISTIHSLQNDSFFTSLPGRLKDVFGADAVRAPTTRTGPDSLAA